MSVLSVLVSCYDYFFQTQSCCTADCISNSKGSSSLHAVDSSWWCPWFSECTKINSRTNQTSRNGNKINQLNSVLTSFKWNETKSMYTHVACQDFKWKHIDNVTFLWNILLYPNLRMDAVLQGSQWCTWAVSHGVFFSPIFPRTSTRNEMPHVHPHSYALSILEVG